MSEPLPRTTTAETDSRLRFTAIVEPLLSLQLKCGGTADGEIAVPELRSLVLKSTADEVSITRAIKAVTRNSQIQFQASTSPQEDGGCTLVISDWTTTSRQSEEGLDRDAAAQNYDVATAALTAYLDHRQRIVTAQSSREELADTAHAMNDGVGRHWTEFVELLSESGHSKTSDWRNEDRISVSVSGSPASYTVRILPSRGVDAAIEGFTLLLVSAEPLFDPSHNQATANPPLLTATLAPALRQPIARIIANAETIRTKLAGPLAEEYSAYAADISAAGQHLMSLVEDLTDLEIVEAGDFTTAPDRIDLIDCARRTGGILGVKASDRDISLIMPEAEQQIMAVGEFRRVLQILINLVGNAIAYSPPGSVVTVTVEDHGDIAAISVSDQGAGLTVEQRRTVFDKFERLGRSPDGGSGLGLYISRKLAIAMNGDLIAEEAKGQGARFTLTLPTSEED